MQIAKMASASDSFEQEQMAVSQLTILPLNHSICAAHHIALWSPANPPHAKMMRRLLQNCARKSQLWPYLISGRCKILLPTRQREKSSSRRRWHRSGELSRRRSICMQFGLAVFSHLIHFAALVYFAAAYGALLPSLGNNCRRRRRSGQQ